MAAFFGAIAFLTAILIFAANLFLGQKIDQSPALPSSSTPAPAGVQRINEINVSKIVPDVIYNGTSFKPRSILIDGNGVLGCVVALANHSSLSLRIGVSPHKETGDPGPNYAPIASGENFMFDPRFTGITELKIHNHARPEEEFVINLGPKCQI